MPAAGGQARLLTEDLAATVSWVGWLDANTLAIAAIEGTRTMLGRLPANGGTLARLPAGEGMCYAPHLAADRQRYACVTDTPMHPGEVFVDRMGRGQPQRLTVTNPALEAVRFAAQEVVRWKGPDGLEIEGVLITPRDRQQDQRYPLVVLPHGGPEGSRQSGWLGYPGQLLAARGYVVLYPNYRGSGGRGVAFSKGDHEDLGGKEMDDILAGIDHVAGLGLVDTARVGIGGWSYGGYLSAWAATRHSERFAAAVMGAGISNWISFTGTTDIPREMSLVHWALWPFDQPALAWERSPMAHLKTAKTPMLILHGAADTRVPPTQGLEMLRGLQHMSVSTEMVTYPREEHGIVESAHKADVVTRFLGWFDRHLQSR
jgi:dipeptidyl aminopeptidase/acylaminoacyl peptidase